ncbi:MAG: alkyl/aryl-sulfatase [Woeseia sp.]
MNIGVEIRSPKIALFVSLLVMAGCAFAADSDATRQLKSRNAEFNKEIVRVSDSVYTAVGYGVSPVSMIVGQDGLVIVDTGIDVASSNEIRADFRHLVDKPVRAIIFTHGHGDHSIGASAFVDTPEVQVWAREGFGHEQHTLEQAGITIQKRRGAMQAGFALSAEQRINNGIAKAYWPNRKGGVFAGDHQVMPTHLLAGDREKITVAGIDLELVAATGETHDHLYVWFAKERVAFSGDNFYKSWPNLYAIRGTPYRDIRQWALAVDRILDEQPAAVVGGHTRPIIGEAAVNETLGNYRDAILYLFDKTVDGINKGLTPNQLVEYVVLPEKFQQLDYLQPYYGNPDWAVRAIFDGYLGWFDGNATSLFPLSDRAEAERIAKVAGGVDALGKLIDSAIQEGDNQWAAQLCDYVLTLEPENKAAMLNKADALTALADDMLTATARNYYLSSAIELRKRAGSSSAAHP